MDERVLEWEIGLPSFDDLTPLSHPLISPELATAFRISPEPLRTVEDVIRESRTTLTSIRGAHSPTNQNEDKNYRFFEPDPDGSGSGSGSKSRKVPGDEADSAARSSKRPRLVWNPQLHKRFVEVVKHLGIRNAVPKTIMQLMNVDGLTRENVASHLQKYRQYLKRMQGLHGEGPSASDPFFDSSFPEIAAAPGGCNSNGIPMYEHQMVPYSHHNASIDKLN